ncbi:glycosyltransferase family 4 protein [Desulfonauticus submarinus]
MKIALIVPEYPPFHVGGGGVVYQNLAEGLAKKGHKVSVIWGYYPNRFFFKGSERYQKDKITFYKIPEIPFPKRFPYLRTAMPPTINGAMSILKILKKEKPDLAHIHGYGLLLSILGAYICKRLRIPYVFTVHGFPKTPNQKFLLLPFWSFVDNILMKRVIINASYITGVSSWIAQNPKLIPFKHKVKVIYNGINLNNLKITKEEDVKRKLNLDSQSKVICSIGRISKMKGFHLVVKILPKLIRKYKKIFFVIVGKDDGYKKNIINLATELKVEKRIIFTGFLSGDDKLNIIRTSDVFVVPSLWEPFGLVALEGLALKKVVVTTGAGGLKEFLSKSRNVIFFNKRKLDSLFDAISSVLDNKKIFHEENFINQFSWDNIIDDYINIYKESLILKKT